MLFKNISVLDENMQVKPDMYVLVQGDSIVSITETKPEGDCGREYDGTGKLLMSGFYNAHAHSPMTLMRGYGENMSLQDWLFKKIFPFEDKLDSNAIYWGQMLAMAESIKYGIVSTSDMYYFCDDMAKAVLDSGAKANISRSVANPKGDDPATLVSIKEMLDFYNGYHKAGNGRILVDASLHAEYTSNPETAKYLADVVKSEMPGVAMHVHISETKSEHENCIEKYGKTPTELFAEAGMLDIPTIAAHCVYSTDSDLEICKAKGTTVATNPVSNMKLASGICNTVNVLDKGVNLAIGTDSVASNNNLDFFEEMKVLAIASKIAAGSAEALSPEQVLTAATIGGAKAQRRRNCGAVKVGNKADLIAVDISGPEMQPVHSIVNNLVYSCNGSNVKLTMVDGTVLYENGEYTTIDIERTIYEVDKATKDILGRL